MRTEIYLPLSLQQVYRESPGHTGYITLSFDSSQTSGCPAPQHSKASQFLLYRCSFALVRLVALRRGQKQWRYREFYRRVFCCSHGLLFLPLATSLFSLCVPGCQVGSSPLGRTYLALDRTRIPELLLDMVAGTVVAGMVVAVTPLRAGPPERLRYAAMFPARRHQMQTVAATGHDTTSFISTSPELGSPDRWWRCFAVLLIVGFASITSFWDMTTVVLCAKISQICYGSTILS